jgi:hypothetical protein
MKRSKIKVEIPHKFRIFYYYTSDWKEQSHVTAEFGALLREHKISYDTKRGLMFFRTEDAAALFKLTHL